MCLILLTLKQPIKFLALLDYVSRAHEYVKQRSWNWNLCIICPSVVRPSVSPLSLNLMHGFLSNSGCCFPWQDTGFFLKFFAKKKFGDYFTNIFIFINMTLWVQKFQNATPPTNRSRKFSNFYWIFFLMVLTKLRTFGIFEILKIEILMNFIPFR